MTILSFRGIAAAAAAAVLSCAAASHAAGQTGAQRAGPHGDPETTPGVWLKMDRLVPKAPPALEASLISQLDAIATVFRPLGLLNPPIGYAVEPRIASYKLEKSTGVLHGAYLTFLYSHYLKSDGSVYIGAGEGPHIEVDANDFECFINSGTLAHFGDAAGELYTPPAVGSAHGFTTYGGSVGKYSGQRDEGCIFITKRSVPPFVPAARERVMKIAIAQFHELPDIARDLQKQLDAMSAADRLAPAYVDMAAYTSYALERKVGAPLLGASGAKDKNGMPLQPLVEKNAAFFDRTRPGDIQALVVSVPSHPACVDRDPDPSPMCKRFHGAFAKIAATLDWAALAAIVK